VRLVELDGDAEQQFVLEQAVVRQEFADVTARGPFRDGYFDRRAGGAGLHDMLVNEDDAKPRAHCRQRANDHQSDKDFPKHAAKA
jgi:hypothetical protein